MHRVRIGKLGPSGSAIRRKQITSRGGVASMHIAVQHRAGISMGPQEAVGPAHLQGGHLPTWMAFSLASWAAMSARVLCSMMRSAVSLSPSACTRPLDLSMPAQLHFTYFHPLPDQPIALWAHLTAAVATPSRVPDINTNLARQAIMLKHLIKAALIHGAETQWPKVVSSEGVQGGRPQCWRSPAGARRP